MKIFNRKKYNYINGNESLGSRYVNGVVTEGYTQPINNRNNVWLLFSPSSTVRYTRSYQVNNYINCSVNWNNRSQNWPLPMYGRSTVSGFDGESDCWAYNYITTSQDDAGWGSGGWYSIYFEATEDWIDDMRVQTSSSSNYTSYQDRIDFQPGEEFYENWSYYNYRMFVLKHSDTVDGHTIYKLVFNNISNSGQGNYLYLHWRLSTSSGNDTNKQIYVYDQVNYFDTFHEAASIDSFKYTQNTGSWYGSSTVGDEAFIEKERFNPLIGGISFDLRAYRNTYWSSNNKPRIQQPLLGDFLYIDDTNGLTLSYKGVTRSYGFQNVRSLGYADYVYMVWDANSKKIGIGTEDGFVWLEEWDGENWNPVDYDGDLFQEDVQLFPDTASAMRIRNLRMWNGFTGEQIRDDINQNMQNLRNNSDEFKFSKEGPIAPERTEGVTRV